jgi:hypothetical protein
MLVAAGLATLGFSKEPGGSVDILIMVVLMATAVLAWRGASRRVVITLWVVGLVAMLGLFRYHVSSPLHLNF